MAEKNRNRKTKEERYLLRKKAVKKEDVTKSRIIKEPGNDAILNQRLPTDLEERKAILAR